MTIDFSTPLHYVLALLPEIFLSVWAMALLLIDVFQKGSRSEPSSPVIGWLALMGIVFAAFANGWLLTLTEAASTSSVPIDNFRVYANFLFLLAAGLFVLISERYLEQERLRLGEVYVLVLLATRSEERRVGKECRSRWSPEPEKKKIKKKYRTVWASSGTRLVHNQT